MSWVCINGRINREPTSAAFVLFENHKWYMLSLNITCQSIYLGNFDSSKYDLYRVCSQKYSWRFLWHVKKLTNKFIQVFFQNIYFSRHTVYGSVNYSLSKFKQYKSWHMHVYIVHVMTSDLNLQNLISQYQSKCFVLCKSIITAKLWIQILFAVKTLNHLLKCSPYINVY